MPHLSPFWATFKGRKSGCIEASSESEARVQAEKLGAVATISKLPYPAVPRLSELKSDCPDFCYSPAECQGRGSCPKRYACSE